MKKIVIAAGTGYLGQVLIRYFKSKVSEIIILSRSEHSSYENVKFIHWDAKNLGKWSKSLERADALINLTGKSVDCRYNEKNKTLIYNSRLWSTEVLGKAINQCQRPPKVWINAASATIYRHSIDKQMGEESGEIGDGFSVDVCKMWESTFNSIVTDSTRKIVARIGIVLGKEGGAFVPLRRIAKFGLGGKMGKGNQFFSWIHEDDFALIFEKLMVCNSEGIYNVTAPIPIRNVELMKLIRHKMRCPFGIPSPKFLLEIGAFLINTETELLLKSRNVVPERLLKEGFRFKFSSADAALSELLE